MPGSVKTTEFRVAFEGVPLSREQTARINQAVQRAVLAELAGLKLATGFRTRFPREWLGIWIDRGPRGPLAKIRKTVGPRG